MTWNHLSPGDVATTWDARLQDFTGQSLFQSLRWGQYKRTRGWTPHYFHASRNGTIVGMLQAFVRTYASRTVFAWCSGGPVGTLEACTPESMRQLARLLGARAFYCRSHFLRIRTTQDDEYLQSQGWVRPPHPVGTNATAVWNLDRTEEQLLAGLNRNWRYSLRQAQKRDIAIEHLSDPPVEELSELCRAMNQSKGVPGFVRTSDVAALFEALDGGAVVYGCRNSAGELIAFHSCGLQGPRAWELLAATSDEGRRDGASFLALWAVILHCRRMNVTHYDLAGVDRVNSPGVADFKRWTGAEDVEWLGEWEWSTSRLLARAVNMAVRHRSASALP